MRSQKFMSDQELKWARRFLSMARKVAGWSKDPSLKVGACIANHRRQIIGLGYNGFPRGVEDSEDRLKDRTKKLMFVVHAEVNAIQNKVGDIEGQSIYVTHFPCNDCAKVIIQSGLKTVVFPADGMLPDRWKDQQAAALDMFKEAGVQVIKIEEET